MLVISNTLLGQIRQHCLDSLTVEACGMVAGTSGLDVPSRFIPMENADKSESTFAFDPDAQMAEYHRMWERNEEPVIIYHSHLATPPAPSPIDRKFMLLTKYYRVHWLIISLSDPDCPAFASWRLRDDEIVPEEILAV